MCSSDLHAGAKMIHAAPRAAPPHAAPPQDVQGEVPSHLVRLKVGAEQRRVAVVLRDCRLELGREMGAISGTCTSERVIKEHRVRDLMEGLWWNSFMLYDRVR